MTMPGALSFGADVAPTAGAVDSTRGAVTDAGLSFLTAAFLGAAFLLAGAFLLLAGAFLATAFFAGFLFVAMLDRLVH